VAFQAIADVRFTVTCWPGNGAIRVTTATSGTDVNPAGYSVSIDDPINYYGYRIGTTETILIERQAAGMRTVQLHGPRTNCVVAGGPTRTVLVRDDSTTDVVFTVECVALSTLRIEVITTGVDVGQSPYHLVIDGSTSSGQSVATNAALSFRVEPGSYRFRLSRLPPNCTLSGERALEVPRGGSVVARLQVNCAVASRVAYVNADGGNTDIWSVKINGDDRRRLTTHPGVDEDPAWAPNRLQLAFTSNRDGKRSVFLMNADGSNVTALTDNTGGDYQPAWSPDGSRIAFVSDRTGNPEIHVMEADGSRIVRLTNHPAVDAQPTWSPDGRRIAFRSERDGYSRIFVVNADGTGLTRLTRENVSDSDPTWSSDGQAIYFARRTRAFGPLHLAQVASDGSGSVTVVVADAGEGSVLSPDGRLVAKVERYWDVFDYTLTGTNVTIQSLDGTVWFQLAGGRARSPAWER
jgi:WD40 repeat protein